MPFSSTLPSRCPFCLFTAALWVVFLVFKDPSDGESVSSCITPPGVSSAIWNATVPAWVFCGASARETPGRFVDPQTGLVGPREGSIADFGGIAKAQDGEDLYAMEMMFDGLQGGVVLESGALDGFQFSTSWLLVFGFGWYAVHIEAIPTNYAALTRGDGFAYPGRKESLNINAALCNTPGLVHFAQKPGGATAINGLWEFLSPDYRATWWPEMVGRPDLIAALPTVACSPLAPLLLAYGITHVNLWVLDVEGAELQVLQTVDWARIRIDVLCIEADFGSSAAYDAVRDFLKPMYVYHGLVKRNDWFIRRPDSDFKQQSWEG